MTPATRRKLMYRLIAPALWLCAGLFIPLVLYAWVMKDDACGASVFGFLLILTLTTLMAFRRP